MADRYWWFRLALGAIGIGVWTFVVVREYYCAHGKSSFNRRLRMMMLVSLPLVYSVGYSYIALISILHGNAPPADRDTVLVAVAVQSLFDLFGVTFLWGWSEKSR